MKIKIIEPYHFDRRYDVRSLNPNSGPVIIGTLLEQAGHDVEIISEYVTRLDLDAINAADFVGISITTYNAKRGFEIARQITRPIVFGGFHASLMPEECLSHADYAIRGDGHPIVQLADYLKNRESLDISAVPNLVYKENGKILYNRTETRGIDVAPDFVLVKNYHKLNWKRLSRIPLLVNASRGCHFRCTFCAIREVYNDFKKKRRETVIEDIRSQIKRQHFLSKILPRTIWITDDNFFSDPQWAKSILRDLALEKLKYNIAIQARTDIARDEEMLKLLKAANVGRIYLGIESLSNKSLAGFKKGTSLDEITDAVMRIKHHGLDVYGLFVFGDDQFEKGDGKKIAAFAKKQNLTGVLVQPLTPFPGTRLFKEMKAQNRILHEDWQDYNGKVVFKPKNLTAAELQKEIYDCYRSVYSPLRLAKYMLFGKRGSRLGLIGEAVIRYLEWIKCKRYIRERLSSLK
jgi:anaerobic magnesium-protoporphyrin IX monomethyl ester cyclase